MSTPYTFNKYISLQAAFIKYLYDFYPDIESTTIDGSRMTFMFPNALTTEELEQLTLRIDEYTDPEYWLDLDRTENFPFQSVVCNSTEPVDIQALIISPFADDNVVVGSMKTVVKYTCSNAAAFSNSCNLSATPIEFCLHLNNYTDDNKCIGTVITDVTDDIVSKWVPAACAGSNVLPPIYKTTHIYGLKDLNPGADVIWTFSCCVSHNAVSASLNSLQKLFYRVTLPTT